MLRILAATTALCAVLAQPVHAAILTIDQNFSASGNVATNGSGFEGITSTSFSGFSTSLGTLIGIGVFFSGTATPHGLVTGNDTGEFISLEPDQPQEIALINGGSNGSGTFNPLVDSRPLLVLILFCLRTLAHKLSPWIFLWAVAPYRSMVLVRSAIPIALTLLCSRLSQNPMIWPSSL